MSMNDLASRIVAAASRGGHVTFISGDDADPVTWAALHEEARAMAAGLQTRGIGPGDHVSILGPTSRRLVTAIQAVWLSGATIVVLPLPMRMSSIEEFVSQTRSRIAAADSALVLVDAELAPFIEAVEGDPPMVLFDELALDGNAFRARPIDPGSLAIVQFTSGSTADPKGVMLPHRTVCANLDGFSGAAHFDVDTEVLVSWLPLYHDMGLVGILTLAMTSGCELVLAGPQDFMASPRRWMEWISRYGGTATAGPNFAWSLATRSLLRSEPLDLSTLRVALNGAEPVDPDAVQAFVDAATAHGMDPGAVFPAFGMAELAIAGTFPEPGLGLRTDDVDQRVLETERYAAPVEPGGPGVRRLARLGRPVGGLEIRVVDPVTGRERCEREVGELEFRGTSVMSGYYNRPDATAEAFHDGWLRTGDLAYLVEGEMVMCGRIKDMMIVGGRNVYPQDVEKVVAELDEVRTGNVIAFGVEGRRGLESVVVVAESKTDDPTSLRSKVAERVRQTVGMAARDVVLVAPGSLPKTSSGKLQRSLCRDRYLEQALQLV